MQYTDTAGQTAQGDVWSPGPMAATVWVLVAGGGQAVVHVATRREVPEDRWMGRAGSASAQGPTLSAKLWRDALGFDPRAVVRGEAEQPALIAGLDASAEPVVETDSVPVPDADQAPIVAAPASELAPVAAPVAPAAPPVPVPVGTAVRIDVDTSGRDARVIGAALEDGRVKVRCEDTVGTVWLLDVAQVRVIDAGAAEAQPVAESVALAPRIAYRKRVVATCADRRCTDGITWCAGCNGYGVLTMGGRKYKLRGQGRTIGETAVPHEVCAGTGLAACGCRDLAPLDLDVIRGTAPVPV